MLEAPDELRCETDFRHEDENLVTGIEGSLDQLQVNLGLAAAGNAVEHERGEARGCRNGRNSPALVAVELRTMNKSGLIGALGGPGHINSDSPLVDERPGRATPARDVFG